MLQPSVSRHNSSERVRLASALMIVQMMTDNLCMYCGCATTSSTAPAQYPFRSSFISKIHGRVTRMWFRLIFHFFLPVSQRGCIVVKIPLLCNPQIQTEIRYNVVPKFEQYFCTLVDLCVPRFSCCLSSVVCCAFTVAIAASVSPHHAVSPWAHCHIFDGVYKKLCKKLCAQLCRLPQSLLQDGTSISHQSQLLSQHISTRCGSREWQSDLHSFDEFFAPPHALFPHGLVYILHSFFRLVCGSLYVPLPQDAPLCRLYRRVLQRRLRRFKQQH